MSCGRRDVLGRMVATMIVAIFTLVACNNVPEVRSGERIRELEDSLKAYRDTLESERLSFNFNTITPVVKLYDPVVRVGDSCRAQIFIAGMNVDRYRYTYHKPLLLLSEAITSNDGLVVKERMGSWTVTFVPKKPGVDSIAGTVKFRCQGCRDSTEVEFSSNYTVMP